jgi:RNA polymerase sigma-70 factor (ECF subfamily)
MEIALRTAAAIMGSREQAADVAQDVALDVLRSLHTLREPEAFDAWVRRIAVRRTLKAVRAQRRPELPLALAGDIEAAGYDRDLLIAARAALAQALTTLPPRQRVALALKYVHDLTDVEIADALGCRRGTVHALLSRGRASLREVSALQALMEATR